MRIDKSALSKSCFGPHLTFLWNRGCFELFGFPNESISGSIRERPPAIDPIQVIWKACGLNLSWNTCWQRNLKDRPFKRKNSQPKMRTQSSVISPEQVFPEKLWKCFPLNSHCQDRPLKKEKSFGERQSSVTSPGKVDIKIYASELVCQCWLEHIRRCHVGGDTRGGDQLNGEKKKILKFTL